MQPFLAFLQMSDAGIKLAITLIMLLSVAPRKYSLFHTTLIALGCVTAFSLINAFLERYPAFEGRNSFYIYIILNLLFAALFIGLCLLGNKIMLFLLVLFFTNYILFATQFIYSVFSVITELHVTDIFNMQSPTPWTGLFSYFSVIIFLASLVWIFHKIVRHVDIHLPGFYWCGMMLAPIMLLFITLVLQKDSSLGSNALLLSRYIFLKLTLNTLILLIFVRLIYELEKQSQLRLANQKLQLQVESTEQIYRLSQETHRLRHEMKNKLFTARSMLSLHNYDELETYLNQEIGATQGTELIQTGHQMFDMVMNQKLEIARQYGIPADLDIVMTGIPDLSSDKLFSLLCNLLDNAIEASIHTENPHILIRVKTVKSYVLIEVENRVSTPVLPTNPHLVTQKADRINHGYGIGIMRDIVEGAGGKIRFYDQDHYFVASVLLPV